MTLLAGPGLVTSGLSLLLDAANKKSYPGSGTIWTDLVQNLKFNSNGTQTPWGIVSGAPSFTFNGSGYWSCTSGTSYLDLGGDCTVILVLYEAGHTVRRTIFEKAGTSYASYQQELAMTWEPNLSGNAISYYSRYSPAYDTGSTSGLTIGSWNMMAIKMSNGYTTAARTGFYSKNGGAWISSYVSNSNTAIVSGGAITIGTGYAGVVDSGSISMVACYNRMLSDSEIAQNYNAWRNRFSI